MSEITDIVFHRSSSPERVDLSSENKENISPFRKNSPSQATSTPPKKKKSGFKAAQSGVVKSSRLLSAMKLRGVRASLHYSEILSEQVARELQDRMYNELARMLTESPLADISEAFDTSSPPQSPSSSS